MAKSLTSRKQEFVRDSIYDAAIDLFARKGFLETNIEDVAQAAGVSRRSFFRYFTTKDHLLAHSIVKYGDVLVAAVGASPAESSAHEVMHDAVVAGIEYATSEPKTRQIMQITAQNLSARQAHRSRMVEVEIRLCTAFAARTRNETKDDVRPRMLALLTLMTVDLTLMAWLKSGFEDYPAASKSVMEKMAQVMCEPNDSAKSLVTEKRKSKSPTVKTKRPPRGR